MALSARDIRLIVSASNQASGPLRQIGRDMSALGRKRALQSRQTALDVRRQGLQNKLLKDQAALDKHINGSQAIGRAKALSDAKKSLALAEANLEKIQRRQKYSFPNQQRALQLDRQRLVNSRATLRARERELLADQKLNRERRKEVVRQRQTGPQANLRSNVLTAARAKLAISSLDNQYKKLGNSLSKVNRDYKASTNAMDLNTSKMNALKKEAAAFNHVIGNQIGVIDSRKAALAKANAAVDEAVAKERELRNAQNMTKMRMAQLAEQQRALNKERSAAKWETVAQRGHMVSGIGRQAQLIGGAGAAALGFAANAAAQLSSKATLAATQLGNNVRQVSKESVANFKAITDQMGMFPSAADDMAASLYDLFSTLNINGKQGRNILIQVNKAAVAGALSTQDATAGVLSILSNFKEIPQTAAGVATALNRSFAAVRFGRMTMAEFQKTLSTTAPAAKNAQQSFNNLAGTMAFLTRSLGPAKAAVGYQRLLEVLGGTQMTKGLKERGVSLRDARGHYLQLDQMIGVLIKKFPQLQKGGFFAQNFFKQIGNIQSTSQARRAFVTLVQDVGGYQNILKKTTGDNNEFRKSYDAMSQTAGVKWAKALNQLKSLWLQLGAAAIPAITGMLQPISRLVKWFQNLDDATKKSIGKWLAYGSAITFVGGTILVAIGSIAAMVAVMKLAFGSLTTVSATAIAFAAAGYLIYQNWDTIKPILQGIMDLLGPLAGMLKDFVGTDVGGLTLQLIALAAVFRTVSAASKAMAVTGIGKWLISAYSSFRLAAMGAGTFGEALKSIMPAMGTGGWIALGVGAVALAAILMSDAFRGASDAGSSFTDTEKQVAAAAQLAAANTNAHAAATRGLAAAYHDLLGINIDQRQAVLDVKVAQQSLHQARVAAKADGRITKAERLNLQGLAIGLDRANLRLKDQTKITQTAKQRWIDLKVAATNALKSLPANFARLQRAKALRDDLTARVAQSGRTGGGPQKMLRVEQMQADIAKIDKMLADAHFEQKANEVAKRIGNYVRAAIPKVNDQQVRELQANMQRIGRMMTPKEMKVFLRGQPKAISDAAAMHRKIEGITKRPIKQTVDTKFKPSAAALTVEARALGAAVKHGVMAGASGLGSALAFQIELDMHIALQAGKKAAQAKSPSKLFARELGKPLAQGVEKGFKDQKLGAKLSAEMRKMILKAAGTDLKGLKGKERAKAVADAIKGAFDTAIQTMKSKWQEIHDLNVTNFGTLFDTQNIRDKMDWGVALNISDLRTSLKDQMDRFRKFNSDLAVLRKRGASRSLIEQIRQLGPDAQPQLSALTGATKKELKQYNRMWVQSQRQLNAATNSQFKSMIKHWRAQGRAMAVGLLLGLRDEGPQLERYFRRLFANLLQGAKRTNKSHSPSLVYMQEGRNIVNGLKLGMEQAARGMMVPQPGRGLTRLAPAGGSYHEHTHYHLPASGGGSTLSDLKKLDYHRRHRKLR